MIIVVGVCLCSLHVLPLSHWIDFVRERRACQKGGNCCFTLQSSYYLSGFDILTLWLNYHICSLILNWHLGSPEATRSCAVVLHLNVCGGSDRRKKQTYFSQYLEIYLCYAFLSWYFSYLILVNLDGFEFFIMLGDAAWLLSRYL